MKKIILILFIFYNISCSNEKDEKRNYYENGEIKKICEYENSVLNGACKEFYKNGKVSIYSEWSNNKRHGETILYDSKGNIKKKVIFNHGIIRNAKLFNKNGDIVHQEWFNEDGDLIDILILNEKGKKDIFRRIPIFVPNLDTLEVNEPFDVEIILGNRRFTDLQVTIGKINEDMIMYDTIKELSSYNESFKYTIFPKDTGKYVVTGFIKDYNKDSIDQPIDLIPFKKEYYVKNLD